MRFSRYSRGAVVAYPFDDRGGVGLRRPNGLSLLRTSEGGVLRSVIDRADVCDVAAILACIADGFDRDQCLRCGVEVVTGGADGEKD